MSNGFLAMGEVIAVKPYNDLSEFSSITEVSDALDDSTMHHLTEDEYSELTHAEWISGDYQQSFTQVLECVEDWAEENGLIHSEEDATEKFEHTLIDNMDTIALIRMVDHANDLDTYYSEWADGMVKDNQLHQEQYSSYEYVGDVDDLKQKALHNSGES